MPKINDLADFKKKIKIGSFFWTIAQKDSFEESFASEELMEVIGPLKLAKIVPDEEEDFAYTETVSPLRAEPMIGCFQAEQKPLFVSIPISSLIENGVYTSKQLAENACEQMNKGLQRGFSLTN